MWVMGGSVQTPSQDDVPAFQPEIAVPSYRQRLMSPELALWLAVCQDAIECAQRIGKGLRTKGETAQGLKAWATESYTYSLAWICDHFGAALGEDYEAERIRREIFEALAGSTRRRLPRRYVGGYDDPEHSRKRVRIRPVQAAA